MDLNMAIGRDKRKATISAKFIKLLLNRINQLPCFLHFVPLNPAAPSLLGD